MKPFYPTPLEAARRCWRRYAGRYVFRVQTERTGSYERGLGDEVHNLHERWNKLGEAPIPDRSVADNLFIAGLPYLPPPRTGATELEGSLLLNGIPYAMRRDWKGLLSELPKGDSPVSLQTYGDMPAQLDLKTASQPMRYGLWSREQFLNDAQAVLGALELATKTDSDVVASRWLYFAKPSKDKEGNYRLKGKVEAYPSDIVLGRDALGRAHLRVVEPYARGAIEIQGLAAAGMIQDYRHLPLPTDPTACDDYKGCDYRALCAQGHADGIRPTVNIGSFHEVTAGAPALVGENQDMSSLFQQFQNGQAPAPALGGAPAFTPPPMAAPQAFAPAAPSAPPAPSFAPPAAPVAAPAPSPYAPNAAGNPMPPFAPPGQQYVQTAQGMYAPVAQAATPAPVQAPVVQTAPPAAPVVNGTGFPGFQGINAPEVRAQEALGTSATMHPSLVTSPGAPAPITMGVAVAVGQDPSKPARTERDVIIEALQAALTVLKG